MSVDLYGQQIGGRLEDVATFLKGVGGCPANVAIGAARLGLKSALITRVGDEPMGRFVREQLAREGVDTGAVHVDAGRLTALVLLGVRDERTFPLIFYRENCADAALDEGDVDEAFIASARALLITGTHFSLAGGARAQRKAVAAARACGGRVILDIDYRPNLWGIGGHDAGESRYARSARVTQVLAEVLPECDLIVGTEEELHVASGCEDTLAAIRRVRALSDAVIVCKRGPQGCVVFEGAIPERVEDGLVSPGLPVEVYNVLGAGDAFLAGYLSGYLRGAPHAESARLGNACGALAVSRLLCSAEFPTLPELRHYLNAGSSHRALREDPRLNQLHRATTRRPGPRRLTVLALDRPGELEDLAKGAGAAPARLQAFRRLALAAAARAAAGRADVGVLLDAAGDAGTAAGGGAAGPLGGPGRRARQLKTARVRLGGGALRAPQRVAGDARRQVPLPVRPTGLPGAARGPGSGVCCASRGSVARYPANSSSSSVRAPARASTMRRRGCWRGSMRSGSAPTGGCLRRRRTLPRGRAAHGRSASTTRTAAAYSCVCPRRRCLRAGRFHTRPRSASCTGWWPGVRYSRAPRTAGSRGRWTRRRRPATSPRDSTR